MAIPSLLIAKRWRYNCITRICTFEVSSRSPQHGGSQRHVYYFSRREFSKRTRREVCRGLTEKPVCLSVCTSVSRSFFFCLIFTHTYFNRDREEMATPLTSQSDGISHCEAMAFASRSDGICIATQWKFHCEAMAIRLKMTACSDSEHVTACSDVT